MDCSGFVNRAGSWLWGWEIIVQTFPDIYTINCPRLRLRLYSNPQGSAIPERWIRPHSVAFRAIRIQVELLQWSTAHIYLAWLIHDNPEPDMLPPTAFSPTIFGPVKLLTFA
jgi:hypothetical protein